MLIIVEGPDGSGKTTLAHQLAKSFKGLLLNSQVVPPTPRDLDRIQAVTQLGEFYTRYVICDRHHAISDLIYAPIVRDAPSPLDPDLCRMAIVDTFVVYCRPSTQNILRNVSAFPQMQGVTKHIKAIIEAYDKRFNGDGWAYRYDYAEPSAYEELLVDIGDRNGD